MRSDPFRFFALPAMLFIALTAAPVGAVVYLDDLPFGASDPTDQIHSDGDQLANAVTGTTVPGGENYTFTSPTLLQTNGSGHAKVSGDWQTLTMAPTDSLNGFMAIDFNLNVSDVDRNDPFFADITLTFLDGASPVTFDKVSLTNGENKYLVYGDAGEVFASISFAGWRLDDLDNYVAASFDDIRQIDVATFQGVAVPEPASWALMIVGFGFVGAATRRSRRPLQARLA